METVRRSNVTYEEALAQENGVKDVKRRVKPGRRTEESAVD